MSRSRFHFLQHVVGNSHFKRCSDGEWYRFWGSGSLNQANMARNSCENLFFRQASVHVCLSRVFPEEQQKRTGFLRFQEAARDETLEPTDTLVDVFPYTRGCVSALVLSLSLSLSSSSAIVRSGPLVRKNGHKRDGGAKSGTNIFDCAYPWMQVHDCKVVCWILKASL